MLMEAEKEKTFGLDDCYSGVTFLFCFCFIISVYAPLNSPCSPPLLLPAIARPNDLHNKNIKKLLPPQWNRKELAKLKKQIFTEGRRKYRSIIPMVWNTIKTIMFFRKARGIGGEIAEIVWKFDWKQTFFREKSKTQKGKWNYFHHNLFHLLISCFLCFY